MERGKFHLNTRENFVMCALQKNGRGCPEGLWGVMSPCVQIFRTCRDIFQGNLRWETCFRTRVGLNVMISVEVPSNPKNPQALCHV